MKKYLYFGYVLLTLSSSLVFATDDNFEPATPPETSKGISYGDTINYEDPTGICVYDDNGRFIGYTEGHQ